MTIKELIKYLSQFEQDDRMVILVDLNDDTGSSNEELTMEHLCMIPFYEDEDSEEKDVKGIILGICHSLDKKY